MKLILSTVGTSILTNQVEGQQRTELIKNANLQENQYTTAIFGLIDYIKETLRTKLQDAREADLKRLSAELNGILGIYEGVFPEKNQDMHVLIATDTYQGKITAEIISNFLQSKGFQSIIYTPKKLTTEKKNNFINGVKDLLHWLEKNLDIENYKTQGYEIIFNLTGGFKSLQGYLNTIGMFYADRLVYIFEAGGELIEIPKLPIEINPQIFKENATEFALMSVDYPFEAINIPKIMLEEYEKNTFLLSEWGILAWNKVKKQILAEKLLAFPKLHFEDSFKKDFQNATPQQQIDLQETLAKVSAILLQNIDGVSQMKQQGGLQYDNFTGKNSIFGHFRLNQGSRVSCLAKNNELYLRHFGQHDYVNDNP